MQHFQIPEQRLQLLSKVNSSFSMVNKQCHPDFFVDLTVKQHYAAARIADTDNEADNGKTEVDSDGKESDMENDGSDGADEFEGLEASKPEQIKKVLGHEVSNNTYLS